MFVRDPAHRLVSARLYLSRKMGPEGIKTDKEMLSSIEYILRKGGNGKHTSGYGKYLTQVGFSGNETAEVLRVVDEMVVVGVVEEWDRSLDLIGKVMAGKGVKGIIKKYQHGKGSRWVRNKSPGKGTEYFVEMIQRKNPKLMAKLMEYLRDEYVIYDHGKKAFDRMCKERGV